MGIEINSTYSLSKTDIDNILKREKMKPSNVTAEELFKNRNEQIDKKAKYDIANNYWIGLYSSTSGSEITQDGLANVSPAMVDKDYTFTDPQFINNFVTKQCFFEDMAKKYFCGDELKQRLNELNQTSDEALNKLSEAFSKGIGNFMNGDLAWVYDQYVLPPEASKNEKTFDVNAFKDHIIDIVKSQKKVFENIKEQNTKEWDKVLDNYGNGLGDFGDKLNSFSTSSNVSDKIENMSYSDVKVVGSAIHALGDGIQTISAETLGAYLGQMKLKGDVIMETSNMSSKAKEALSKAISQNITRRIDNFSSYINTIGDAYSGNEDIAADFCNSFSKLSNTNINQFRTEYAKNLSNLLKSITRRDLSNEIISPYVNKDRYATTVVREQVNDWNSFIDNLNVHDDIKGKYYISGISGNVIDAKR